MRHSRILTCLASAVVLWTWAVAPAAQAQEPAECRSPNPSDWPEPAKPYFMIVVDSSYSMYTSSASTAPSCRDANGNAYASRYTGHARCAVHKTIRAFAGLAEFGLAQFIPGFNCGPEDGSPVVPAWDPQTWFPGDTSPDEYTSPYDAEVHERRSGNILVPLDPPPSAAALLSWVDNLDSSGNSLGNTSSPSGEITADGYTPLGGVLRDMYRYFSAGWNSPVSGSSTSYATPLDPEDPECRQVNVILLTDGDEYCDPNTGSEEPGPAQEAAAALYQGFSIAGDDPARPPRSVRTYVINFAGGNQASTDAIAAAGGTDVSLFATNEAELSAGLADIIASAIEPEACDNSDNNCNGCTDEGYRVYCNRRSADCREWTSEAERTAYLDEYKATVTAGSPQGNLSLLPCWDPTTSGASPETKWLCRDPGELCDEIDNNCEWDYNEDPADATRASEADEGFTKCPFCPTSEDCDGLDDDCDGLIDENESGLPLDGCEPCIATPEVCDDTDNDCDGLIDEDGAGDPLTIPCALASTPGCQGVMTCTAGDWSACEVSTGAELCDGLDNDCDGLIDEDAPSETCDPSDPDGRTDIVYQDATDFPNTICIRGETPCGGACQGAIGPTEELCDGLDNDCDGEVDVAWNGSELPMVGGTCGACDAGVIECRDGALQCSFTGAPPLEVCNGVDDDCDGEIDEAPLGDAPVDLGCWSLEPEACDVSERCSAVGVEWCAPEDATCTDLGELVSPCAAGALECTGGNWQCGGGRAPSLEVCDGVDNDCDSAVDDSLAPPVGDPCGVGEGACSLGSIVCLSGVLECTGTGPQTELCNGMDDDCDGEVDNGIPLGNECSPTYDAEIFPGDRSGGACQSGHLVCDPEGSGELLCDGGVGPEPEVCDGMDNDCDGRVDEPGPASDGIEGTADPDDPSRTLGEPCGTTDGLCEPGILGCVNGTVACEGGVGSQEEECDCEDNDCDGLTDETDPPICSPGKSCVAFQGRCFCAAACQSGEFPCATGAYSCSTVEQSGSGIEGRFCVPPDPCARCDAATVKDAQGSIECGPNGTDALGRAIPVCVCKAQACHGPCFGVSCDAGLRCVPTGSAAGTCREDNCYFFGCSTDSMCVDGSCVDDPCAQNACESDEVCEPGPGNDEARCVPTCAGVACAANERCEDGACEPTGCDEACDEDQVCLDSGECGQSLCEERDGEPTCSDGSYCNPGNGACIDDPCTGVHCPEGQGCTAGECVLELAGGGAGGSGGGSSVNGQAGATAGTDAGDGSREGAWGLATGSGGCSCRVQTAPKRPYGLAGALALAAAALIRRRPRYPTSRTGGLPR